MTDQTDDLRRRIFGLASGLGKARARGLPVMGAVILVLYGVIPTFQPAHFGRVYAAYGGIFIVMALLWGWLVDKIAPDRIDLIGSAIALTGVCIMMYWPRVAA